MEQKLDKERYARHIALQGIGEEGQRKLARARVLVVGVGGLGSPAALYLAAAGVGEIGLVDDDTVSLSNLQRQILYKEGEVGMPKVACARKRLKEMNGEVKVREYFCRMTASNAASLISGYDLVVDGTDTFAARYLIGDVTAQLAIPYIYGAIREYDGQVSVFNLPDGRAYRDLYPDEEALLSMKRTETGVIGVLPGIVGSVEAAEAIKVITGCGTPLSGKLWTIDILTMQSYILSF